MKKYSKLMSLVLRHAPEELELTMDAHGWVNVNQLVGAISMRFPEFTIDTLDQIIAQNDKRRFEYGSDGFYIRACQGHSVDVDLQLEAVEPPEWLYHGTSHKHMNSICQNGLQKMKRHAVHLSETKQTAQNGRQTSGWRNSCIGHSGG